MTGSRSTSSAVLRSPAEFVDRIGAARDLLGLTRMGLAIDMGGLDQSAVLQQIDLLAEHVIPAFAP